MGKITPALKICIVSDGHDHRDHLAAAVARDTAGPAINPMIKIINIVALLIVPLL